MLTVISLHSVNQFVARWWSMGSREIDERLSRMTPDEAALAVRLVGMRQPQPRAAAPDTEDDENE